MKTANTLEVQSNNDVTGKASIASPVSRRQYSLSVSDRGF